MVLELPVRKRPTLEGVRFKLLRELVREEAAEFEAAMLSLEHAISVDAPVDEIDTYWAEVIDAVCDIIVVLHNTTNAMGIDIEPFFEEVHRTNMAKVGGPVREDGKRLKPEGWKPPRIKEMLQELRNHERSDD